MILILPIFSIMPVIGLLNSNIAGIGSPDPSGVDYICNKTRFLPSFVLNISPSALYELYACY